MPDNDEEHRNRARLVHADEPSAWIELFGGGVRGRHVRRPQLSSVDRKCSYPSGMPFLTVAPR